MIKVFKIVSLNGNTGQSDLSMNELYRLKYAELSWSIEEYHRGINIMQKKPTATLMFTGHYNRRYNGEGNTHTNYIEGNEVGIFHIHYTTERYQHLSQKNEHYAEETDCYTDVHGALQCLIQDANFRQSPSF